MRERSYMRFIVRHFTQNLTFQVLLEPGYVLEEDCNNEAKRLRESGREFYDGKYKDHFNNLFNSIGKWFKAMGDDPVRSRSSRRSRCLTNY